MNKVTEYRALWPNNEEVWLGCYYTDRDEFFKDFDELIEMLDKAGVPKSQRPRVECRDVTIQRYEGHWLPWGDHLYNQLQEQRAPVSTSGPQFVNQNELPVKETFPTRSQVAQVRAQQWGFDDPCIVCRGDFRFCGHTVDDTAPIIKRIQREFLG